jgi:ATP-dependent protease ClpP protease subunit
MAVVEEVIMVENKCIQFKNSTDANNQELYFYGDIVSDEWSKWTDADTCPQDVQDILNQIDEKKPLNIYINSGGGSVFAGLAMYNMLKRNQCQKTVYIDGLAASIASVISMAGDKIVMPSNAFLMIHKAWNCGCGNADDMRKMASDLDKIDEGILNVYADNLKDGVDIKDIKTMVDAETWLTGEDAAKYFNVDVVKPNKAAASISNLSNYKNVPKELIKIEDKSNIEHDSSDSFNNKEELEVLKAKLAL